MTPSVVYQRLTRANGSTCIEPSCFWKWSSRGGTGDSGFSNQLSTWLKCSQAIWCIYSSFWSPCVIYSDFTLWPPSAPVTSCHDQPKPSRSSCQCIGNDSRGSSRVGLLSALSSTEPQNHRRAYLCHFSSSQLTNLGEWGSSITACGTFLAHSSLLCVSLTPLLHGACQVTLANLAPGT